MGYFGQKEFQLKNGKAILIRDAAVTDAEKLIQYLDVLTLDGEGQVLEHREFVPTIEEEQHWVESTRANHNELILAAFFGEELIGLINFHQEKRERLRHCGVLGMGIIPGWRSCGVGSLLLGSLLEWLSLYSDIEIAQLAVLASNARAIALYQKHGFNIEGRRSKYIKFNDSTYVDEILMARPVKIINR